MLSMGANANQSIKDNGKDAIQNLSTTVADSLEGGVNTVVEQPLFQNITKVAQGLGRGDISGITGAATDIAKGSIASFMPTLGNQIKQYADNTWRVTYSPSAAKETINRAQAKLPILAGKLPVAHDTFGRPKETFQGGSNTLLNVFLNPSFVSKYNPSPEAKMALDIFKDTEEKSHMPTVVPKYFSVSGKRFNLTPQEYSNMQQTVGQETLKGFSSLGFGLKPMSEYSDATKRDMAKKLQAVLEKASLKAKVDVLDQQGILYSSKGGLKLKD
jgi:hypothetical protein